MKKVVLPRSHGWEIEWIGDRRRATGTVKGSWIYSCFKEKSIKNKDTYGKEREEEGGARNLMIASG